MVLFFLNVRIAGIFFENCTDCTDFFENCTDLFKKMYGLYGFFFENCTDCTDFFSKIVRIVRISSENVRIFVRIFSKKFWPPCNFRLGFSTKSVLRISTAGNHIRYRSAFSPLHEGSLEIPLIVPLTLFEQTRLFLSNIRTVINIKNIISDNPIIISEYKKNYKCASHIA